MQFSQVIGQNELKTQLANMIQQNRLSHALLFLGKEGTGGLSLARAFAQFTVCEKVNRKKDVQSAIPEPTLFGEEPETAKEETQNIFFTDSCGECPACRKASLLIHPDIHFSYPIFPKKPGEKSVCTDFIVEWRDFLSENPYGNNFDWLQFAGAENKQGNINVHECGDIIHKLSLKSFEAEYKILIMWMPEMLGKEGNKLLKLIEEPPPNTLFILVAENESLILPTLLSRTQLIKIPLLSPGEIVSALILREGTASEKAQEIAAQSEGNYHEALQQLQHAEDDWEVLLRSWLNSILKTGPLAQIKWVEEVSKTGREKQKQFLKYFTHLLQQSLRLKITGDLHNPALKNDFAFKLNKLCDISQHEAIINELDQAAYYIERNANAKMLFHALTIKLYHIISNKSVILMQ